MKKYLGQWVALLGIGLGACTAEVQTRPAIVYDNEPALVDVEPGVRVVENQDDAVYVSGGAYWVQREGRWWTAPDYRGHWVTAEPRAVPDRIRAYPAERYRHYRRP